MADTAKINDWLQIVGTFGVVASLIFVGLQMRQTQAIALADTYSTRAAISVGAEGNFLGTPQHYSAMAKLYSGKRDALTAEEYVALEHDFIVNVTMIENNFLQYEMGFLPEDHWRKNVRDLDCRMSEPFFRSIGEDWFARDRFRKILDESMERGRRAEVSCYVVPPGAGWPYFNPVE